MQYKMSAVNFALVNTHTYLINKGVRACALESFNVRNADELLEIEQFILSNNLEYYIIGYNEEEEMKIENETVSIWIFKYPYQKMIIYKIENQYEPNGFMYEYLRGTLLGYPPEQMDEYLNRMVFNKLIEIREKEGGEENVSE